MTETPEERRERIDSARRDQAELLRQVGHEHAGILIRPSAAQARKDLDDKLDEMRENGNPSRCYTKPEEYADYDIFNVPSPGRAKMMCAGCPAFEECDTYASVDKPGWGVYGGKVYGRDMADKDRREYIKIKTEQMREGQDG